jgi:hypothetical protein
LRSLIIHILRKNASLFFIFSKKLVSPFAASPVFLSFAVDSGIKNLYIFLAFVGKIFYNSKR